MQSRNVIPITDAIKYTGGKEKRVKQPKQTNAWLEEAKRLRRETAERERGRFGIPTPQRTPLGSDNSEQDDDVKEDDLIGRADIDESNFLCPTVDDQLSRGGSSLTGYSIMEEITEARLAGKLAPFVPGPIGSIQNHKIEPAPAVVSAETIKEEERTALHKRQKRNDNTLSGLAERYS